jgi:hypothetical protein
MDGKFYDISSSSTIGCAILLEEKERYNPAGKMVLNDITRSYRDSRVLKADMSMHINSIWKDDANLVAFRDSNLIVISSHD